jgi:hypothetical protein
MALTKVTNPLLSASGTADATTYLRGDATWATVDALPTQASQSGKYLTTDGTTATWSTIAQGSFPFYKRDGTLDKINLTSDSKVPFFKDTGTASNIALTI